MSTIQCTKAQADCANMTGNGIKLFQNSDLNCNIRTVTINDEPWFVAKDICEAFGDSDHKRSISRLDEEERQILPVKDRLGRNQDATVVNESGLYSLLFGFEPQKAKKDGGHILHPMSKRGLKSSKALNVGSHTKSSPPSGSTEPTQRKQSWKRCLPTRTP